MASRPWLLQWQELPLPRPGRPILPLRLRLCLLTCSSLISAPSSPAAAGMFGTWAEVELQVCQFKGHSHGGFPRLDAAIESMRKGGITSPQHFFTHALYNPYPFVHPVPFIWSLLLCLQMYRLLPQPSMCPPTTTLTSRTSQLVRLHPRLSLMLLHAPPVQTHSPHLTTLLILLRLQPSLLLLFTTNK